MAKTKSQIRTLYLVEDVDDPNEPYVYYTWDGLEEGAENNDLDGAHVWEFRWDEDDYQTLRVGGVRLE